MLNVLFSEFVDRKPDRDLDASMAMASQDSIEEIWLLAMRVALQEVCQHGQGYREKDDEA